MQPGSAPTIYAIDAGGSRTVAAVARPGEPVETWVRESFAIASVGEQAAGAALEAVLREIAARCAPGEPAVGCLASSSIPVADEAPVPAALLDVISRHAPGGRLVVVNDVIPPLWASPLEGIGVIACSGTGSSVIGRNGDNRMIKVGGHEHIVSDQGSAYSIAREGLRAAARDTDGTGPSTKLRAAAEAFFAMPLPALGRWLAELPRARSTVASFAPSVIAAAVDDDNVAVAIVEAEALALVDAIRTATLQLAFGGVAPIGFAGGVLRGSPYFRGIVERELETHSLTDSLRANLNVVDGSNAGIEYAKRIADADAPEGLVLDLG
jgi:N-acetylglucosamine kinase-like BadF-type ATPase